MTDQLPQLSELKNTLSRDSADPRVHEVREIHGKHFLIREALPADAPHILSLFSTVYQDKYPLDFGSDCRILGQEISDPQQYLWVVAELEDGEPPVGCMMLRADPNHRLGKAGGGAVLPAYRKGGLASTMLTLVVDYMTRVVPSLDVVYGTSRTVSEGPTRMVTEAGFKQMGLFPNAVQIGTFEHLNLDVYFTDRALAKRRKPPNLIAPFQRIYGVAAEYLGLEEPSPVTDQRPLERSKRPLPLEVNKDALEVAARYLACKEESRLSQSFFPFHFPNWCLSSKDGGTEVFIWYGGVGKQAAIVGYRTDRENIHDLLESVARTLDEAGAAYVELLVDAYDYVQQRHTYTARFMPSAYFPAMGLASDGLRDDYIVLSRTCRLLDFTDSVISPHNAKFLRAYLELYSELYIEPLLGPLNLLQRQPT